MWVANEVQKYQSTYFKRKKYDKNKVEFTYLKCSGLTPSRQTAANAVVSGDQGMYSVVSLVAARDREAVKYAVLMMMTCILET